MYRSFHSISVFGSIPEINNTNGLLLLPNHSSWWDGFFTYYLNKLYFNRKFHIMMLEHKLEEFKFFNKLGAYSIKHDSPKSMRETLAYTSELLDNEENSLVNVYPEGVMGPSFNNDVNFKPGIDVVFRTSKKPMNVLVLGMKIISLFEQRPQVFFKFSPLLKSEPNNQLNSKDLQEILRNNLRDIDQSIIDKKDHAIIFRGRKSRSE